MNGKQFRCALVLFDKLTALSLLLYPAFSIEKNTYSS